MGAEKTGIEFHSTMFLYFAYINNQTKKENEIHTSLNKEINTDTVNQQGNKKKLNQSQTDTAKGRQTYCNTTEQQWIL